MPSGLAKRNLVRDGNGCHAAKGSRAVYGTQYTVHSTEQLLYADKGCNSRLHPARL